MVVPVGVAVARNRQEAVSDLWIATVMVGAMGVAFLFGRVVEWVFEFDYLAEPATLVQIIVRNWRKLGELLRHIW